MHLHLNVEWCVLVPEVLRLILKVEPTTVFSINTKIDTATAEHVFYLMTNALILDKDISAMIRAYDHAEWLMPYSFTLKSPSLASAI